jgi:hypothetical protein
MATMPEARSSAPPTLVTSRRDLAIGAISCLIIGILGLQTFASFVGPGRLGWPFIPYPMYKTAHYEGERLLYQYKVFARHADSSEVLISARDMPFWIFKLKMIDGVMTGNRPRVQPLVTAYCKRTGKQVVSVRVEDMGVALSRKGVARGLPPQMLATMDIGCQEANW